MKPETLAELIGTAEQGERLAQRLQRLAELLEERGDRLAPAVSIAGELVGKVAKRLRDAARE